MLILARNLKCKETDTSKHTYPTNHSKIHYFIPVLYVQEMQFQVLATQKLEPGYTARGHTETGPGEKTHYQNPVI